MSSQQIPPQNTEQSPPVEPQSTPAAQQFTAEEQQAYDRMMSTLSQMNTKIEKVKKKLQNEPIDHKTTKNSEMTDKLIQSKESSEIITKENLLTDITESYEKVVIDVYSENGKLKKRIEEMARLIKEQSNKIYDHTRREKELVSENEQLRSEIARLKDEKLMMARGHVPNQTAQRQQVKEEPSAKKKASQATTNQNEDFDFWSMPQNDYGKKKKDFVQDSNLWVNQKQVHDSVFLTEDQSGAPKKKK